MVRETARKTLYYVRSLNGKTPVDLQSLINKARTKFPTVADSEIKLGSNDIIRIQHFKSDTSGVFVHFVRYVPGEKAPTLSPKVRRPEDNGGAESAPAGKEFKDGDSFILANRHNVIFCGHGVSVQKTVLYLSLLFDKTGIRKEDQKFELKPASNIDKLKLIQEHGVRAIRFSIVLPD